MATRRRRWPWVVLGIFVILLAGKHFLLGNAAAPGAAYVIDLDALHRAAIVNGGALPDRIEVEKVGDFAFPRTLVVAGEGFRMHHMTLLAHRVVWPDSSVVIDTAMAPAATKKMPGSKADAAAFGRVEAAMKKASAIVFTHEHVDHVGGVAAAPDLAAVAKQVRMTREQYDSPKLERGEFPAGALAGLTPLSYQGLYTLS